MIGQDEAERFARGWIDAFNRHDLDAVLSHYVDDVEFTSPAIIDVAGEPSGTLRGKDALRSYFATAIGRYPDLGFELLEVLTGVNGVSMLYRSLHRNRLAVEVMQLNGEGRVVRATVHYGRTTADPK